MNGQTGNNPPDYLIIGHITKDQFLDGYRLGGTAVYCGVLAQRMGLKVAVFTSGASNLDLDIMNGIDIVDQPSPETTTFINEYSPEGRTQRLLERAEDLDLGLIPEIWRQARIIHLAPVAREVPISGNREFPQGILAYSLQGWLRDWDEEGWISSTPLPRLAEPVRDNSVGFLSIEDLGDDRSALKIIQSQFPTLVTTLGPMGVELRSGGRIISVPAPPAEEFDPTGAGDIFAAAFLVLRNIRGMEIERTANLANALAASSVSRQGTDGIPEKELITDILKAQK
jgi:sugar/nucleoside kinase (ribokinase family)